MSSHPRQTTPFFPPPPPPPFAGFPLPPVDDDDDGLRSEPLLAHLMLGGSAPGEESSGICDVTPNYNVRGWRFDGNGDGNQQGNVAMWTGDVFVDFSSRGHRRPSDFLHGCDNTGTSTCSKKAKVKSCSWVKSTSKMSKEKLGSRITALHQLVSPYGKTDTASVLLEAYGHIKLLHSEIRALSCRYMDYASPNPTTSQLDEGGSGPTKALRSRGLCLAPIPCAMNMESSSFSDYPQPEPFLL